MLRELAPTNRCVEIQLTQAKAAPRLRQIDQVSAKADERTAAGAIAARFND
jgi:hypothetical protein